MKEIESIYEVFKANPLVSTDSRRLVPGSIFFALRGPNFNGNNFAEQAIAQGCAYAIIDEKSIQRNNKMILVDDVLTTLQALSHYHRRQFKIPFLAITGSNGKTTTKELINRTLSKKFRTHATQGNLNNHIGVPLTILSIPDDAQFAIIEMGANHCGEIESYCKIAEPDFGLITNVGKAHLEGFGGIEGVKKGKGELYQWIAGNGKLIFLNGESTDLVKMSGQYANLKTVDYGNKSSFYCQGHLIREQPALSLSWKCDNNSGHIDTQIVGSYNFENILAAVCIGNYFQVDPDGINDAISGYVPDNSRSQVIKKGSNIIILDAYNANPTSMEAALTNFEHIESDNKILFLGEMAELGAESKSEHRRIASLLDNNSFRKIILVGKLFAELKSSSQVHFEDSVQAAAWLKEHPVQNAYVLIKGSRSTRMEKILDAF